WMAVVMASLLLGEDINKYKFTIDVAGQIDGPSAGALMTITILSVLLGDTVKPTASMTGTINPDGTIGPIGGIPQKLEGAAKTGKKLILVPLGQRFDRDQKTGQNVDSVEKGQRVGIEVREVGDIYQAYEALTGKKLPKPEGAVDEAPDVPAAAFEKVKSKAKEWTSRYRQERAAFMGLDERYRQPFLAMSQQADASGQKSDGYFNQGLMAGAYAEALEATLLMTIATEAARLVNIYITQGAKAAEDHLNSTQSVNLRLEGLRDRLKAEKPKTATDSVVLADAYGNLSVGYGLSLLAQETLRRKPKNDQEKQEIVFTAALYHAIAAHVAQVAMDALDVGLRGGTSPAPDAKRLERFAETLRRAADANLTYFDAVIVDGQAKARGVHPGVVRQEYRTRDFDYTFALATVNVLPWLKERLGAGEPVSYATLGTALASYQFSSSVVAKYYSLGAQLDREGNLVGVDKSRAMTHMLDFAEKRSRELIALARKTGNEPVLPILYHESGKIDREGKVADKFSGLQSFWLSSLEAELMAIFSGKFKLMR
ncbi:MAG: S16 family serine protease, partial [Armatimonadota bacterium]